MIHNATPENKTLWKVELHSHTYYSMDSLTSLDRFIQACRARGIHRVAITDHSTATGALILAQRYPDYVIPGEEIMTTQGELLAFFVKETIPPFLTPEETIERLRAQGAVISVSHPFDRLRKGAWDETDLRHIIGLVDAIEVYNARCLFAEDNDLAATYAAQHSKLGTVGSDAHTPGELGRATLLMEPFEGAGSFYESLKTARKETKLSPAWVHGASKYAKWMRKLGLNRMPEKTEGDA